MPSLGARSTLGPVWIGSLEWARWAVGRWANFPVDQIPGPLVLVGPRAIVEQGFKTGEAKLAFVEGAIESSVALPDRY